MALFFTAGYGTAFPQSGSSARSKSTAQSGGHLAKGISLFKAGRYDDALAEFNAEVAQNGATTLAYYYAARIRMERKQFDRAEKNLAASVRDSSTFSEAYGVLAYTYMLSGKKQLAANTWGKYLNMTGKAGEGEISLDSIELPEVYAKKTAAAKKEAPASKQAQAKEQTSTPAQKPISATQTVPGAKQTDAKVSSAPSFKPQTQTQQALTQTQTSPVQQNLTSQIDYKPKDFTPTEIKKENEIVAKLEKERLERERQRKAKNAIADTEARANNILIPSTSKSASVNAQQPDSSNSGKAVAAAYGSAPAAGVSANPAGTAQGASALTSVISTELKDIDERINNEIKRGIWGIAISVTLLIAITALGTRYIRKKRKASREYLFADEVGRAVREREPADDRLDRESELAAAENGYFAPEEPLTQQSAPQAPAYRPEPRPEPLFRETEFDSRAGRLQVNAFFDDRIAEERKYAGNDKRQGFPDTDAGQRKPVTEEVKALVTRMQREGYAVEDIARVSDLTKTEIELIIAVRSKNIQQMISEISEEENERERDQFGSLVKELDREGMTHRDIARKLGISVSEVNFMLTVMNTKG